MIDKLKVNTSKSFDMKDLGHAKCILGMRSTSNRECDFFWLSQEKYIEIVLERFTIQ